MEPLEYIQIYGTAILILTAIAGLGILPMKLTEIKQNKHLHKIEKKHYNTVQKFRNIINNDTYMNKIKKEYKSSLIKVSTIITLIIISIIISTIIFYDYVDKFIQIPILLIIIVTIIGIAKISIISTKKFEYIYYYKNNIIKLVLKEHNSKYTYNPYGQITETMYAEAEFENKNEYDIYTSEDRIDGNINGYNITMAEVNLQKIRTSKDEYTFYVPVFNGPVAIITIPEFVKIDLYILNKQTKSSHLFLKQIEIDNSIFEEIYNVYSDDEILAMRILTPSITNKILDLYNQHNLNFEIRIKNNTFYLRFRTENLFAPNIKDSKKEAANAVKYLEILKGIEQIMSEIMIIAESLKNI